MTTLTQFIKGIYNINSKQMAILNYYYENLTQKKGF